MQGPFELVCSRGNVVWKVCATSVTMNIVDIVALFCTKAVKSGSSLRRPNHLRSFTLSTIIVFSSKKFSQRLKARAEIYTMHSFAQPCYLYFLSKMCLFFAKLVAAYSSVAGLGGSARCRRARPSNSDNQQQKAIPCAA